MNGTRFVDYFQTNGTITQQQADEVRVALTQNNVPEEQMLLDKGYISDDQLARARSELFNIPFVDLQEISLDEGLFSSVSIDKLKRYNAVPFEQAGHIIKVAMSDPFDVQAIQALESMLKEKYKGRILVHIATQQGIDMVLDSNVAGLVSNEVSDALDDIETPVQEIDTSQGDDLNNNDLQNAPVARIVNSIFTYAIKSEASDIHIEPLETGLRVRFRIHGVMQEKLSLPKNLKQSVVARLKIMSNLKIDEKRVPQDGRIQVRSDDLRYDVRVSTLPSIYGEKVVMRLLDNSEGIPPLTSSGMRGSGYQVYTDAIKSTNGIILITGPTGSGKTRTLASTLAILNDPKVNIITLENPVEIRIKGVTQVQINPDVGLTFASGLRSILRQDPDIVMVGEIRDEETASLAVEASLTGHLVLATLHTNSSAASVQRLIDMGVEPYLLASTMRIAAAQRLPRRVCRDCMEVYEAPAEVVADINSRFSNLEGFNLVGYLNQLVQSANAEGAPEHLKSMVAPKVTETGESKICLYRGKGCTKCGGTGYKGRIGIFEVLKFSEEISDMTIAKAPESKIEKQAISEGMITMLQDGYLKALEGLTTVEEVLRVSRD